MARAHARGTRWHAKVKITPNFSFARVDEERLGFLSVCEQRNAALVRMTLEGERKRGCELRENLLI